MDSQLAITTPNHSVINIMTLLKTNTSTAHKKLEKSSCFKRLFADDYTMDEYALLLSYFYSFYNAIEPMIFNDLPSESLSHLQHRTKSHLLHQDVNFLGVNTNELAICKVLPNISTFTNKMGVLYVLEGSLLGGRVIGQHLKKHFGEDTLLPLNFYSCYGADLQTEWQNFALFMGQCFNHQPDNVINDVVDSANATFTALQQWIEDCSTKITEILD
jgi:heme oxygenase (biliverdin-IX-beta and delta-forming)